MCVRNYKGIFMNRKSKKSYEKAVEYYEKGKINKALELCEEVLSGGLDNSVVLNFKGLLLYQKGNLNEAVMVWKINKDLNDDNIAKKYIKDSILDKNRLELYKQGQEALNQLKVDKALDLFKKCAESDFNSIKVNTGIAMCYQKKGEFYKASEYVNKALHIDKDSITAKGIEKKLKEDGLYFETRKSLKIPFIIIISLFITVLIIVGSYEVISKYKDKIFSSEIDHSVIDKSLNENSLNSKNSESEDEKNEEMNLDDTLKKTTKEEPQTIYFDKEKLKILISNNDLDGIYEQLENFKGKLMNDEDSEVYNNAVSIIKEEGVSKFYDYGLWYFNNGNYTQAKISLDKAYTYCEGNSLKEHILFYRASNSLKESENEVALSQYEEYYNQYPQGTYVQEALYELSLLSNSIDKDKSKHYANILIDNFPDSIYINDNIKYIVQN